MSKFVTLHGFGGGSGGTELNFEVVGGTTEPSNPKENTIWVNTDKEITGWHFSTEQPENMAEGEVWFHTGATSTVDFNALKTNTLMVFPLSAKQMVSGALTEVTAKIYQSGEWKKIKNILYLLSTKGFDAGIVATHSSGSVGWSAENNELFVWGDRQGGHASIALTFDKAYDLTVFNTLTVNVTEGWFAIKITKSRNYSASQVVAQKDCAGTTELDISALSGEHYIHVYLEAYPDYNSGRTNEIVLKV